MSRTSSAGYPSKSSRPLQAGRTGEDGQPLLYVTARRRRLRVTTRFSTPPCHRLVQVAHVLSAGLSSETHESRPSDPCSRFLLAQASFLGSETSAPSSPPKLRVCGSAVPTDTSGRRVRSSSSARGSSWVVTAGRSCKQGCHEDAGLTLRPPCEILTGASHLVRLTKSKGAGLL